MDEAAVVSVGGISNALIAKRVSFFLQPLSKESRHRGYVLATVFAYHFLHWRF